MSTVRRSGIVTRLSAITLLLLVLSPFTAPFATWDLADFLGTTAERDLFLQDKSQKQDATAAAPRPIQLRSRRSTSTLSALGRIDTAWCVAPRQIPLRI
jgi:hypothetical protein